MVACSVRVRGVLFTGSPASVARTYVGVLPGLIGRRNGVAVMRAYIVGTITIPFQPCWTLWGHGRRCSAFSKCRRNFRMRSKLGRGSKGGMFVPTRACTSSYVMVTSMMCRGVHDVSCGRDVKVVRLSMRDCRPRKVGSTATARNEDVLRVLRTVESATMACILPWIFRQKIVLSINGNSVPCG